MWEHCWVLGSSEMALLFLGTESSARGSSSSFGSGSVALGDESLAEVTGTAWLGSWPRDSAAYPAPAGEAWEA